MKEGRQRLGTSGFTLVEAVVALVVAGIGIVGVMSLVTWMVRANGWSGNMTTALTHGQDRFETFREVPYSQMGSGSDTRGHFTRTWTAARSASDRYTTVELEMVWTRSKDAVSKVAMQWLTSDPSVPGVDLSPFGIDMFAGGGGGSGSDLSPEGGEPSQPTAPGDTDSPRHRGNKGKGGRT